MDDENNEHDDRERQMYHVPILKQRAGRIKKRDLADQQRFTFGD